MTKIQGFVVVLFFGFLASGVLWAVVSTQPKSPGPAATSDFKTVAAVDNATDTVSVADANLAIVGTTLPESTNDGTNVAVANVAASQVLGWSTSRTSTKKSVAKKKPTTNTSTNNNTNAGTNTSTPPPAPGEIRITAYNTGYGWPDNTPPGGEVSNPVLHTSAGGTGTFQDPITLAVGHSIISGQDILDYPQGTKFYIPTLRRYFIVEDTCGDGSLPQNGPCHKSAVAGTIQLDLWVGGQGASSSAVLNCESFITGVHLAIQNPASNYRVVTGPIFNGTCSLLYGDTLVLQ